MVRTQIQLTDDQAERLRDLAHRQGTSVAALIRDAVARLLAAEPHLTKDARKQRIMALAGRYRSGRTDVSERHDEYFAESVLGDNAR